MIESGLALVGGCVGSRSVVRGVLSRAARYGVELLVVAGRVDAATPVLPNTVRVVSLVEVFGEHRATSDTVDCVAEAVAAVLAR